MKRKFALYLCIVVLLQCRADAQNPGLQPFTPATNYMSLRGYERWRHYCANGNWPPIVATQNLGKISRDVESLLSEMALAKSLEENPLAIQHIVVWSFDVVMPEYYWVFRQRFLYDKTQSRLVLEVQDETTDVWNVRRTTKITEAQVLATGARAEKLFVQGAEAMHTARKP